MCEVSGKLQITYEDGLGYIKGRIGHKGFYVPRKGGTKMARIAKANEGGIVSGATMRGMLVRIDGVLESGRGGIKKDGWWWR